MSLLPGVADKDVSPLSQDKLCLPHHILEERGLVKVGVTVQALLDLPPSRPTQLSAVWHEPECCVQPAVIQPTPLPSPNPRGITRDQRAPQGEDPVSSGSLGVCFCLTETGDTREKHLRLFIWCQPPPSFCQSHSHLYTLPSYRASSCMCVDLQCDRVFGLAKERQWV